MARKMLNGWRQIADALDVVERTAQRLFKRADDPLPVYNRTRSQVCAWDDEVAEWRRRNEDRRSGGRCVDRPAPATRAA